MTEDFSGIQLQSSALSCNQTLLICSFPAATKSRRLVKIVTAGFWTHQPPQRSTCTSISLLGVSSVWAWGQASWWIWNSRLYSGNDWHSTHFLRKISSLLTLTTSTTFISIRSNVMRDYQKISSARHTLWRCKDLPARVSSLTFVKMGPKQPWHTRILTTMSMGASTSAWPSAKNTTSRSSQVLTKSSSQTFWRWSAGKTSS